MDDHHDKYSKDDADAHVLQLGESFVEEQNVGGELKDCLCEGQWLQSGDLASLHGSEPENLRANI